MAMTDEASFEDLVYRARERQVAAAAARATEREAADRRARDIAAQQAEAEAERARRLAEAEDERMSAIDALAGLACSVAGAAVAATVPFNGSLLDQLPDFPKRPTPGFEGYSGGQTWRWRRRARRRFR